MGSNEKFCLRWNDFESNISVAFRELREEKDFFDVTLACDDSQLQAHKVILSACSPFFRNILRKNPHQHPLLYLKGVKFKELVSVLNFMYMGEVNVAQEELNSFLSVAEELRVKGLTQNNSEGAKSDSKSSSRSREPPERDVAPPPAKKMRHVQPQPAPVVPMSSNDDDIQEVVPVKSEPRELNTQQPLLARESNQDYQDASQQNAVALQENYQDDSYDYEGYEGYDEGAYDSSGMQQVGADGNKGAKLLLKCNQDKLSIVSEPSGTGNILIKEELNLEPSELPEEADDDESADTRWDIEVESRISLDLNLYICMACSGSKYSSKQKINVISHIKSKHLTDFAGFLCELCPQVFNSSKRFECHMRKSHNVLTVSTACVKSEDSITD